MEIIRCMWGRIRMSTIGFVKIKADIIYTIHLRNRAKEKELRSLISFTLWKLKYGDHSENSNPRKNSEINQHKGVIHHSLH